MAGGVICFLLLSLVPALSEGQAPGAPAANDAYRSATTIQVNSDLVLIPVSITDGKGRFVNSLDKEHFKVYEDKVEQVISHFAAEDAPVSVSIVFDTSDSMAPKMHKAREAVAELLKNANPEDEFSLVQFSDRARLVAGLTKDREELWNRMAQIQTEGSTALLDAIFLAMKEMKSAQYARKAIIIISDGEDNSSRHTLSELKQAAGEADIQLYAIGIIDSLNSLPGVSDATPGPAMLKKIVEESGGRLFKVYKLNQLPEVTAKIGAALRTQYLLGYSPSNNGKTGTYRRVIVKLKPPKGLWGLHAFWRRGYYAPSQ